MGRFNKKSIRLLESTLYSKAGRLIEEIRKQEAAAVFLESVVLSEADPKPRVEKDADGNPVTPTADMFKDYFEPMSVDHVAAQMQSIRDRWKDAAEEVEKAEEAAKKKETDDADKILAVKKAEIDAIGTEMSVGQEVLKNKQVEDALKPRDNSSPEQKVKVQQFVQGLSANSLFGMDSN